MRYQSLQQLALSVRQRADLGGQQNAFGGNSAENITDLEMTTMLNASVARLWKAMVRKGPENYAWGDGGTGTRAGYIIPTVQGTYRYNLPFDFLKEKGVDLALDASNQNWATMRPYTERDRNLFSFPLQTSLAYAGWQNMRWQIQGSAINILPQIGPLPATIRLLYAPAAPILCPTIPAAYVTSHTTAAGDLVYVSLSVYGEPAQKQVFVALNAGTTSSSSAFSVPTSSAQQSVFNDNGILFAYQAPFFMYANGFDGINGWEDIVVLDCAIKCGVKQEADVSALIAQLGAWKQELEEDLADRNQGDPMVLSGGFGMCEGGPAYGNGFGPFGGGGW